MLISLVALDVLLFYVFFEAMLIPMYFLIGGFGGAGSGRKAAVKFLLYNLFGGLIMLAAVIGLYVVTARQRRVRVRHLRLPGHRRPRCQRRARTSTRRVLNALFLGFMFAFAVKAPLWPFHRWLPDAAVEVHPGDARC